MKKRDDSKKETAKIKLKKTKSSAVSKRTNQRVPDPWKEIRLKLKPLGKAYNKFKDKRRIAKQKEEQKRLKFEEEQRLREEEALKLQEQEERKLRKEKKIKEEKERRLKAQEKQRLEEKRIIEERDERIRQEQIYRERLLKGEQERVAPPPTSRKFAGSPPANLIISIEAIAKPAPLIMLPILPSRLM